jgi:methylated-DNA-[protein]-cysteine S-methyltransferase
VKHFSLFPTALGACGIAWFGDTVLATHLPERSEAATAARFTARMRSAVEDKPPPPIQRVITSIAALLDGEQIDLSFVACEFGRVDAFAAKVYEITRTIPPGETRTYGEIALLLGDKLLAQNVGRALGRNHLPIIVPCHRVIGANGRLTGFSAAGGVETKLRMLAIEGARVGTSPGLFGDLPLVAKLRD